MQIEVNGLSSGIQEKTFYTRFFFSASCTAVRFSNSKFPFHFHLCFFCHSSSTILLSNALNIWSSAARESNDSPQSVHQIRERQNVILRERRYTLYSLLSSHASSNVSDQVRWSKMLDRHTCRRFAGWIEEDYVLCVECHKSSFKRGIWRYRDSPIERDPWLPKGEWLMGETKGRLCRMERRNGA
jgi:hypothetical protein